MSRRSSHDARFHAEYQGLRVTPNVCTTIEGIDTFAEAMEAIKKS